MTTTYAKAGVNISAGNRFAVMIRELIRQTWPEVADEIGGFAGGGKVPEGASKVKGGTDGAGTKTKLAALLALIDETRYLRATGQDALAMSAMDAYAAGISPAYALDTICVGRLEPEKHIEVIKGVIDGCKLAGCVLAGGETAELPGIFLQPWIYLIDTAVYGFDSPNLKYLPIEPNDRIYGWLSGGPAANGLSLIRRAAGLEKVSWWRRLLQLPPGASDYRRAIKALQYEWPELYGRSLADAVLQPTPIYISDIEALRRKGAQFCGHAHITGGGLVENVPRIIPTHLKARIYCDQWSRPPIFPLIQKLGNVPADDMARTFNNGLMVVSVAKDQGLQAKNLKLIGEVLPRENDEPQVELVGKYSDEYVG